MTSRLRRSAIAALCASVTVTGCSFGGLNSLPLPGTDLYRQTLARGEIGDEAALLRKFSEPQLPGAVLQPPPMRVETTTPSRFSAIARNRLGRPRSMP